MYNDDKIRFICGRGGIIMEAKFEWSEDFCIGVDVIDREHQRLFRIINKLFALREEEKDNEWACQEGVKYFKGHAIRHFEDEETYMRSIGYEGLAQHQQLHKGFRDNMLPALEQELERTNYAADAVDHFLGVCAGWLVAHTRIEDSAITGKRPQRWDNLLPGEELEAMRKAVIRLMFDMFRLESQLISDAYGGERFGRGVYYRLVYGIPGEEKRQEIFLVFEEKLLVNTVGKALGLQTNKLDTLLVHAARYAARQFVERIREHYPDMNVYQLLEENLLTYEQFRSMFERETPQVSLLFNTGGAGYFAYCVIAPHLLEKGVGTPIEPDNAMDEVEKFLMRRTEEASHPQKKVLIVDDSATIREAMRALLEDYEVTMASSGVGAIRAISLNRPDLVLLDYEMPVCDGRQTLEMLRSEEEFADLPVIFLTGRRDTETMIKVMPLNPAGYLIKSSKPAELKKEIDQFFKTQENRS